MKIPRQALAYILFQRTQYLEYQAVRRLSDRFPFLYPGVVRFQALLFQRQIREKFNEDMKKEYQSIKKSLPPAGTVSAILDIGSGVGGIDVLLAGHYEHKPDICLLDKTAVDRRVYYKFEERGSFYNSLEISRDLLIKNAISPTKIHVQEATDDNRILFEKRFDLVISLISWGFHYPVSTYLDTVFERLQPGGVLIFDVRKGTGAEEVVKKKFGNYTVILEMPRARRIVARKLG